MAFENDSDSLARSLQDPAVADQAIFGGKASTLGRLTQAGFPVPAGVALSCETYLRDVTALAGERPDGVPFKQWAANIRERILSEPIPAETVDAVTHAAMTLPAAGDGWIVRSSAVGEDSASDSFAGQLDSFTDVAPSGFAEAIRSVWASAWSPRAAEYRERRGLIRVSDLPVGVLIQRFIEPEWAGVLFTTAPTPGATQALVEAVPGRGEALVSGTVNPSRYWLDPAGRAEQVDADGSEVLDSSVLGDLHATGLRLVETLGGPQDIEWALSGSTLYVVQSRPITTIAPVTIADPDSFRGHVIAVTAEHRDKIPAELAEKDKFKLRLIATEAGVGISHGWLVSLCRETANSGNGLALASIAEEVASGVKQFPQVSMVLQRPARLDGEIVRQFSPIGQLTQNLRRTVGRIGGQHEAFDLIVTEIYQAEKSGISHIVDGRLVVEVAYGSYVPKGVVPTSLYVTDATGRPHLEQSVTQETAIFIEKGQTVERTVNAVAALTSAQLAAIERLTLVVSAAYPDVSVEFGVLADGTPYLIDIIPDMSPVGLDNVRVMSPGQLSGTARVAASEELAARSLDAHFHSERGTASSGARQATVIVAPRPFLALEEYLGQYESGSLAFVFEQGSLLGHLAIILREHKVPAIVVPEIRQLVRDGDLVNVDTSSESLFSVVQGPTGA